MNIKEREGRGGREGERERANDLVLFYLVNNCNTLTLM